MNPSGRFPLRRAEAATFRSAFDVLDADRDGKISYGDLENFFSSSSTAGMMEEEDIRSMMAAADLDRDGYVELEEFERVVMGRTNYGEGEWMEEVFRLMDRDGDGMVGFEDLRAYLSAAGMRVGDDDVRDMISMGGGEEEGGVCFESFVRILAVDF